MKKKGVTKTSKLYCYVDESGDLGLKKSKTSTSHFVIAAVLVFDETTRDNIESMFVKFKQDMKIPHDSELKFHSLSDKNKTEILSRLKKLSITIYAFVFEKEEFIRKRQINRPIDFHQEVLTSVFMILKNKLQSAAIMIDRSIDARLDVLFRAVIKKAAGKGGETKIVFARSKNQSGLQLADLVAGSVLRAYEKKDDRFLKIIKQKTKLYPC